MEVQYAVQTLPSYFLTQVHPENPVIDMLKSAQEIYELMKPVFFAKVNPSATTTPEPEFLADIPENKQIAKNLYDYKMTYWSQELLDDGLQKMLPPETPYYYAALKYIEDDCLKVDFTKLTKHEILEIIKRINMFTLQGIGVNGPYRDQGVFIFNIENMPKARDKEAFKQVDSFILKKHPLKKELWQKTRAKIWNLSFAEKKVEPKFTEEEKELLKELMSCTPDHKDVPAMMDLFTQELVEKIAKNEETVALMAYAHQKLIEIHPFLDGNGRTARLFMNLLGMWKGKKPLLIDEDAAYTKASKTLDPVEFTKYLISLEQKHFELAPLMEKCLRYRFDCICDQYNYNDLRARIKEVKL